jgi:hypothetical protein
VASRESVTGSYRRMTHRPSGVGSPRTWHRGWQSCDRAEVAIRVEVSTRKSQRVDRRVGSRGSEEVALDRWTREVASSDPPKQEEGIARRRTCGVQNSR